ncbi:MAG: GNAT family N-acetyltransferase [Candidatus Thorarchaeota archaeon]
MIPSTLEAVWERMRNQLLPFYGDGLSIEISDSWSSQYDTWFKELEAHSFRESLRYDSDELLAILNEEDALFLFIVVNESPEGVILGYPIKRIQGTTFYLDTFAIKIRGKGIGRIVLRSLIEWANENEFKAIEIDTEDMNEIGVPLRKFYEDFGFVVQSIEDDGNISMRLAL